MSSVANSSPVEVEEVNKENRKPIYFGGKACQVKLKKLKYANTSIPVAVASTSTTPVVKSTSNADASSRAGSITNTSSRAGTSRDASSKTNSLSRDLNNLTSTPAISSITSLPDTPMSPPNMSSTPYPSPSLSSTTHPSCLPSILGTGGRCWYQG